MKYFNTTFLVLSFCMFSVATNYCMQQELTLDHYEPNTIENLKKQQDHFIFILDNEIRRSFSAVPPGGFSELENRRLLALTFFKINYLEKNPILRITAEIDTLLKGHSILTAILLNPHHPIKTKIDIISRIHSFAFPRQITTAKDIQFAQLELHKRKYKLKDKISLWNAVTHIENSTQQLFPNEIIKNIGFLMLDSEKSLL